MTPAQKKDNYIKDIEAKTRDPRAFANSIYGKGDNPN